jgi:hypothetical protein
MRRLMVLAIVGVCAHFCGVAFGQMAPPTEVPQYIELMKRPTVRQALELVDYQLDELEKLSLQRKVIMGGVLPTLEQVPVEERQDQLKKMQENLAATEKEAYQLLLPFQKLRIDQIKNQVLTRAYEPTAGLTHHRMVTALDLREDQLKVIREKAAEVDQKLQERLEALRKQIAEERDKARREVLAVLTEEQRRNYQAIVGEPVDLSEPKPIKPHPAAFVDPKK